MGLAVQRGRLAPNPSERGAALKKGGGGSTYGQTGYMTFTFSVAPYSAEGGRGASVVAHLCVGVPNEHEENMGLQYGGTPK